MALLPTFDELYQLARAEIQLRRPDLADWREGSNLDAIAGMGAVLADEAARIAVELFAELFFDTAEDEDLDRLALDRLGLVRKPATAAIGEVTWTRGTAGAYTIPAGTKLKATVGSDTIIVRTTATTSLPAGASGVAIAVQAAEAGRHTNAAAGTITVVVDSPAADPSATVTNAQPLAGGDDAQTDESFRTYIRRYYSTLRRGTVPALELGALTVPGVTIVTVDESEVEDSGWVYVYIGDPDGRSNDSLADLVDAEMINWRAAGSLVEVLGATREEVAVSLRVSIEPGTDRSALADAIRTRIIAYGDTLAPNRRARRSRIEQAAHDASDDVVAVTVTSHADDLVPSANQNAIRFVSTDISIVWAVVPN